MLLPQSPSTIRGDMKIAENKKRCSASTLRDGSYVADRRCDLIFEADERSKLFRLSTCEDEREPVTRIWQCDKYFDQGVEGACHKEGTEVLTDDGWVDFRNVKKTSRLATVNQATNNLEFQLPSALVRYHYDGDLIISKNRNVKFAVTPDHRMYVRRWNERARSLNDNYEFVSAGNLGWYLGLMAAPVSTCGDGSPLSTFIIGKLKVKANTFLEFLGLFIADGCIYHEEGKSYRIEIAAKKRRKRENAVRILGEMGVRYVTYKDRYTIHHKALFNYLKPFSDKGVLEKRIPPVLRYASAEQIRLFIDGFCSGDGHVTKCGRTFLYTSSKDLADGLQELLLRIGVRSSIIKREPRDACIEGRLIKKENVSASYVVSPWRKTSLSLETKTISTEKYSGDVYCATVPNSTLITRYEGTILISGNCAAFGFGHVLASMPVQALGLTNDYLRKELYWEAQRHDQFPGGEFPGAKPKQGGTSLLAILKLAKKLGWIDGYHWGFGLRDLQMGIAYEGPAYVGVQWFRGMYRPDKDGYLRTTGGKVGGHCICIVGVDMESRRFIIHNSWGKDWGMDGEAYISFDDMDFLLKEGGQVAFVIGQHYNPTCDNRKKYSCFPKEDPLDGGHDPVLWRVLVNNEMIAKAINWLKELFK